MVYRIRRLQSFSIRIYELVPDDVGIEKVWSEIKLVFYKTIGGLSYWRRQIKILLDRP